MEQAKALSLSMAVAYEQCVLGARLQAAILTPLMTMEASGAEEGLVKAGGMAALHALAGTETETKHQPRYW